MIIPKKFWYPVLIIGLFVVWTYLAWLKGFKDRDGELNQVQLQIEIAHEQNKALADKNESLEQQLIELGKADAEALEAHREKYEKVIIKTSECTGENDFYGQEAERKFTEEFNKNTELLLK